MTEIHTEKCCIVHGCKYLQKDCPVVNKTKHQSHACEYCRDEGIDPTKADKENSIFNFEEGAYYQSAEGYSKSVMYLMGFIKNADGEMQAICHTYALSKRLYSVRGMSKIPNSAWVGATKEEFDSIKEMLSQPR